MKCKQCKRNVLQALATCPSCGGELAPNPKRTREINRVQFFDRRNACMKCEHHGRHLRNGKYAEGCGLLAKPCEVEQRWLAKDINWCPLGVAGPGIVPESLDERITIGVTGFNRPEKLTNCLSSIWRKFPNAKVILADNGDQLVDAVSMCPATGKLETLPMPFDAGVSVARNAIVDHVTTPFFLLMEDDFIVDERADIPAMLDVLESCSDFGLVGGVDEGNYRANDHEGGPQGLNGELPMFVRLNPHPPTLKTANGNDFMCTEFVINFSLWRTEFAKAHRWDDDLKIGEHTEFFFRVREADDWVVAFCPQSKIGHDRGNRSKEYAEYRNRAEVIRKGALHKYKGTSRPRVPVERTQCTIVATPGRSGSSLLAAILNSLGVKMFFRPVPTDRHANKMGYFEDNSWLEELRKPIDLQRVQMLVDVRSVTRRHWGIKAPQMMDRWADLSEVVWPEDTRVLAISRPVDEIARSLERVNNDGRDLMAWARGRLSAFERFRHSVKWPIFDLEYDDLLYRPETTIKRIVNFLDLHPTPEMVDNALGLIDPSERHIHGNHSKRRNVAV